MASRQAIRQREPRHKQGETMDHGTIKILLVDDEKSLLNNLTRFFEDEGFHVLTAKNGEEAITLLAQERVHGAIVDMRLPGIDGNEVIIEAHRLQPAIQIIIHTGSTNYLLPPALRELGIDEERIHLKPVLELASLSEHMRQLIQGHDYES